MEDNRREPRASTVEASIAASLKKGPRDCSFRKRKHQVTKKEKEFDEKLEKLFDIAAPDDSQDQGRLPFLIDQRTKRELKLGGRVGLTGLEKRKQARLKKQKIRVEKEADGKQKRFTEGFISLQFLRIVDEFHDQVDESLTSLIRALQY
jgi:hypothetical protein